MNKTTTAYIGLGSNLGDCRDNIRKAIDLLRQNPAIESLRSSDTIETAPLGNCEQPKYLNAVAEIKTSLSATQLFQITAEIEKMLGRTREKKWAPRTIDLDLLLFSDELIDTEKLTIPHKQLHLRSFVLEGLCQLAPDLVHPILKVTVKELASRLGGGNFTIEADKPQLISIAGLIGIGKTTLTEKLAEAFNADQLLEPYDTNPFMSEVYAGKEELALDSELYFLTERAEQLSPDKLTAAKVYISDYLLEKSLIYAKFWLNSEQLSLYKKLHHPLADTLVSPALVIYLHDTVSNCLDRIHKRNRPYEQKIEPAFLEALDASYKKLFDNWKKSPVISIDLAKFNCMAKNDIDQLAEQIKNYISIQT
ncbi:2-amino-4-hydroxy-6-hydroxymethyldihydropteridine diphosphokinase [Planctomycetota bacterium]